MAFAGPGPGAAQEVVEVAVDEVRYERTGAASLVTIDRQQRRNAIDGATADALVAALERFEADEEARVLVLTGAGAAFCSGADLTALDSLTPRLLAGEGPLGFTRRVGSKPTIAAIDGWAVAGGLELALWCDLRVAASDAVFGVFCRRWGVPLIDGGTIRLPRLIGQSHALDMILTGRGVSGEEALRMGLVNRLVEPGRALEHALELAGRIAAFPQLCMRADRRSAYEQWGMSLPDALVHETDLGLDVVRSGETLAGATRFASGAGRHGKFE